MSELTNSDSPLVKGKPNAGQTNSVGSGVIQDKPCAGGLDSILNTQRSMGITGSLVSSGNLLLTKDGVNAFALLPGGAKEGIANYPQYAKKAKKAIYSQQQTKHAQQLISTNGQAQSTVTNNILPDHTAAQSANYLSTTSKPQNRQTPKSHTIS